MINSISSRMIHPSRLVLLAMFIFGCQNVQALVPEFSVTNGILRLAGVSAANPVIYDNDWWTDVPDAAYLWAKASLGQCQFKSNIVSRDKVGHVSDSGRVLFNGLAEAAKLTALAFDNRGQLIVSGDDPDPQLKFNDVSRAQPKLSSAFGDTTFELAAGRSVSKQNFLAIHKDWTTHWANELEFGFEK